MFDSEADSRQIDECLLTRDTVAVSITQTAEGMRPGSSSHSTPCTLEAKDLFLALCE